MLGCLIIGILNNGLFLLDVSPFWQQAVKGFVILIAVAIDNLSVRKDQDGSSPPDLATSRVIMTGRSQAGEQYSGGICHAAPTMGE